MPKAGPNLKLGLPLFLFVFILASVSLYFGAQLVDTGGPAAAAAGGDTGGPAPSGPVSVTVVAQNLQFDKRTIVAAPGAPVTVTFNNQDAGVPHDIAFYTTKAATTKIAVGNLITGVATEELKFNAPSAPGNYYFRCDVHPDTMNGTFSVK